MKAKHLIAAFAVPAVTGCSVFAQEFVAPNANFVSTRTPYEGEQQHCDLRAQNPAQR
jgi:hypothetical protein